MENRRLFTAGHDSGQGEELSLREAGGLSSAGRTLVLARTLY